MNLSDATEDQALLQATASAAGLSIGPDAVAGTAQVMAAVGQAIDAQPAAGTVGYLTSVVQVQTLAEGTIAAALAQVGAGTTDISTVESEYTETNVESPGPERGDRPTGRAGRRDLERQPRGRSRQPLDVRVHGLAHRDALAATSR